LIASENPGFYGKTGELTSYFISENLYFITGFTKCLELGKAVAATLGQYQPSGQYLTNEFTNRIASEFLNVVPR
jgi:hypothetical protein